jgi:excisionase family DNA binding protein
MTAVTITQITAPELEALINNAVSRALSYTKSEPAPQPQSCYITRKQVCTILHISIPTVHAWVKKGKLQSYHIGGRTLFKESEVLEAVKAVDYSLAK